MQKFTLCLVILLLAVSPVFAQDGVAVAQSPDFLSLVASSLAWCLFAVFISQVTSIGVMWLLGLPPSKLTHEIEDVQNTAVGACFFIISLIASLFVGFMTTDGFTPDPSFAESTAWIVGGVLMGVVITIALFLAAHRLMKPEPNEGLLGYIKREIVLEQNAALAFFFGGLAVTPFISVVFQLL